MRREYRDKDFFISDEGYDVFEMQKPHKTNHLCITDEADEIVRIDESISQKGSEKLIEIVVGIGDHIPLWKKNQTLKWKFNSSFDNYLNAENFKNHIREVFTEAINKWGDSSPITFQESNESFDFEIILRSDNCTAYGCTLASAFFPNSSLNVLSIYPKMFQQNRFEQVETMIHEIGHIFGLRHYFAKEKEASWRSEIFGDHYPLTIMNYGHNSTLTEQDKLDLKNFYSMVWNGELNDINGLPIRLYNTRTQL